MKRLNLAAFASLALALFGLLALSARADTVFLKDGSVIHGKIAKVTDGKLTVTTDFAGELAIKQDHVASFETDEPVYLKTKENSTVLGKVECQEGGVAVAGSGGNYRASIADIKSSWRKTGEDPELLALKRHWALEISTDISGKSGNSTGFAGAVGAVATLVTPTDSLKFYASGSRAEANKARSEDTYKGGAEYNAFFSKTWSWYVSSELMQDNVKDIALRVSTLGGLGYNAVHSAKEDLQFRVGLSYRYETYDTVPATANFSSAGCNFAVVHRLDISSWAVMKNSLSYVPSFKDTANYVIDHDSNFTLPFGGSKSWSMRFGVTNEYVSIPVSKAKRLDTTYYVRLVLNML